MSKKHLNKVDFDFIRYANCWEDADVLLDGLKIDNQARVMSIGSAGDNCFSILSQSPQLVIAVDISPVQLFLIELKKEAIRAFDYADFIAFIGITNTTDRLHQFKQIREHLSKDCHTYWAENLSLIENGIVHQGKFENYFQLFKNEVLPTVHNRAIIEELFTEKDQNAQERFHDKKWNTEAWKVMYRQFFGVEMMGTHGRDPEFLKHVKGSVPDIILEREIAHLKTPKCQRNYFLYYILNNHFNVDFLPHYLRQENYALIKANLDKLVLHHGLLDTALKQYPNCTHFNLSDIFEYMTVSQFRELSTQIISNSSAHAKLVYWNLLIERMISTEFPDYVTHLSELSDELKAKDMGYFYGQLIVEQKR